MDKQKEIAKFVHQNGETTKKEIMDAMPWNYYCNGAFHFGNILSRMVKNGTLKRVKRGVFEWSGNTSKTHGKIEPVDENQIGLF